MDWKTYKEGVLQTESIDLNSITKRLSIEKTVRLLHAGMGLATEAGEFVDAMKKTIFYGKEFDEVNLVEELGDLMWYATVAMDVLNVDIEEVWRRNREKLLKKRYKKGKFTEEAALNRDLDAERESLEGNESYRALINNILVLLKHKGPMPIRQLHTTLYGLAGDGSFINTKTVLRKNLQKANSDGLLDFADGKIISLKCDKPCDNCTCNHSTEISKEESEYQMRPQLEIDIHYSEDD